MTTPSSNHSFGYSYARVDNGNVRMFRVGRGAVGLDIRRVYPVSVILFRRSLIARLFRSYDFRISNGA